MYRIVAQEHTFTIYYKDVPLFTDGSMTIRDASGKIYPLQIRALEEREDGNWHLIVEDEAGTRKGKLVAEKNDCSLRLLCRLEQPTDVLRRVEAFSAREAVSLRFNAVDVQAGFMANYSYYQWWTRPEFGNAAHQIPGKTRSLTWRTAHEYAHLLTVPSGDYISELKGDGEGVCMELSSDAAGRRQVDGIFFTVSCGEDPFKLPALNARFGTSGSEAAIPLREEKQYPPIMEKLGWCTWDAFYHEVDEEKVYRKASELAGKELPVKWMVIDDGWSQVKDRMLHSLEADKEKFPSGLPAFVDQLKQQYGILHVGLWHAISGYWHGIHPELAEQAEMEGKVALNQDGSYMPSVSDETGESFYSVWHSKLKHDGIDFVKVDSQGSIALFQQQPLSLNARARGLHSALDQSVQRFFDETVINCMGMEPENIWNRPISSLSRNSDDFFPHKIGSLREHILQNVYNSYYHSAFYWGDWDMFWTRHPDAKQHAVLRAVSGGPVYFSDPLDQTDPSVLWPLILRDGTILRCEQPGLPTKDCLLTDYRHNAVPLKVWNRYGIGGVIAAFHVLETAETAQGFIGPRDLEDFDGESFVIYDYFRQTAVQVARDETLAIQLEAGEASIYGITPVRHGLAPIGLVNKYVPVAGMESVTYENGGVAISLKEGGLFAYTALDDSLEAFVQDLPASAIQDCSGYRLIDCSEYEQPVTISFRPKSVDK